MSYSEYIDEKLCHGPESPYILHQISKKIRSSKYFKCDSRNIRILVNSDFVKRFGNDHKKVRFIDSCRARHEKLDKHARGEVCDQIVTGNQGCQANFYNSMVKQNRCYVPTEYARLFARGGMVSENGIAKNCCNDELERAKRVTCIPNYEKKMTKIFLKIRTSKKRHQRVSIVLAGKINGCCASL